MRQKVRHKALTMREQLARARARVCVTGGTHGITNERLQPLAGGNTCRKSQPPNANIILIAIEKYRHYAETLFSFSFASR